MSYGQAYLYDNCEGGVVLFAYFPVSTCASCMTQANALKLNILGQLESFERTGTSGFQYVKYTNNKIIKKYNICSGK